MAESIQATPELITTDELPYEKPMHVNPSLVTSIDGYDMLTPDTDMYFFASTALVPTLYRMNSDTVPPVLLQECIYWILPLTSIASPLTLVSPLAIVAVEDGCGISAGL